MSIPRKKGGTAAKALSTALSAAMVVAFTPAVALGADEEAAVNGTPYATLAEAVAAAEAGDTVTLLKDISISSTVALSKPVFFDGNHKTVDASSVTATGTAAVAISLVDAEAAEYAAIENLTIVGPNASGSADGQFGLGLSGGSDDSFELSNITVRGGDAGIEVAGGTARAVQTIDVSNNEQGGILVSGGTLNASQSTLVDSTEGAAAPVAWSTGGTLRARSSTPLYATAGGGSYKYYLDRAHASAAGLTDLTTSSGPHAVQQGSGVVRVFSFSVSVPEASDEKAFIFSSAGAGDDEDNNPRATLYKVGENGELEPVASSDDADGTLDFAIFASLENGSYQLHVDSVSASCSVSVSAAEYVNTTGNYTLSAGEDFFAGTKVTEAAAKLSIISKLTGESAREDFDVEIWKAVDNGADILQTEAPSAEGRYCFLATPNKSTISGSPLVSYFDILDPYDISSYDFEADTVSVYNNVPVTLAKLNLKVTRPDTGAAVTLPTGAYKLIRWEDINGVEVDAPSTPGSYYAMLEGQGNYSGTVFVHFTAIAERIAAAPAARTGLTYAGYAQAGVPSGTGYTVTGGSATNAGSYTATAKLAEGYVWSDGTTGDKHYSWSIARAKVAVPTAVTGLKYTGSGQHGVSAASNVTLGGTYYATNVGSYTATASLPNTTTTSNYQWSDGTLAAKSISWSIAKGSLPVGVASVFATAYVGTAYTAPYSYAGDGAVTASSSNPAVATATASAGVLTVTAKAAGTATITISAAGTSNCLPATGTVVVTVKKPAAAPSGSFINADGSFAGGSNGGVPGTATDAQQAAAAYKVTTPAGSGTPTVTYMGGVTSGSATIPSTVKDQNGVSYRVTAVAKSALKGTKISKATLGGYVKTVGSYAFSGCSKLSSLNIGKNVSSIGTGAVKGCSKLKTVTVKSSKLTKASIKNLVKGTKVTTIKCSGVSKQVIAKYLKWAKAYNKKVAVK